MKLFSRHINSCGVLLSFIYEFIEYLYGKVLAVKKHITLLTRVGSVFLACVASSSSICCYRKKLVSCKLYGTPGLGVGSKLAGFEEICLKILRTISLLKPRWSSLPTRCTCNLYAATTAMLSRLLKMHNHYFRLCKVGR